MTHMTCLLSSHWYILGFHACGPHDALSACPICRFRWGSTKEPVWPTLICGDNSLGQGPEASGYCTDLKLVPTGYASGRESGVSILALALEAIITNKAEIHYWINHLLCSTLGAEALATPMGTLQQIVTGPYTQAHDEKLASMVVAEMGQSVAKACKQLCQKLQRHECTTNNNFNIAIVKGFFSATLPSGILGTLSGKQKCWSPL